MGVGKREGWKKGEGALFYGDAVCKGKLAQLLYHLRPKMPVNYYREHRVRVYVGVVGNDLADKDALLGEHFCYGIHYVLLFCLCAYYYCVAAKAFGGVRDKGARLQAGKYLQKPRILRYVFGCFYHNAPVYSQGTGYFCRGSLYAAKVYPAIGVHAHPKAQHFSSDYFPAVCARKKVFKQLKHA